MNHVNRSRLHAALTFVVVCASIVFGRTTARAIEVGTSAQPAPPMSVRSADAAMLELMNEGVERSITFAALVETIGRSHDIVYVEFGYCAFGHLDGCLLPFVASSQGGRRYLRILVTPDKNRRSHDRLLGLIRHELQHALEVIQHLDVVDVKTMEAMYRRIGTPLLSLKGFETSAARAAGDAVLTELSRPQSIRGE